MTPFISAQELTRRTEISASQPRLPTSSMAFPKRGFRMQGTVAITDHGWYEFPLSPMVGDSVSFDVLRKNEPAG